MWSSMSRLAPELTARLVEVLRDTHLPRIRRAAEALPANDLWWRPHPGAISVGTILLHLEGNVRQWILSGLDGRSDDRDRASEFVPAEEREDAPPPLAELLRRLETTVGDAAEVILALDEEALVREHTIQGYTLSGAGAVLHVVEHFSWHTGQAVWIAKARGGPAHGLSFYDDAAVNAARND